MPWDVQNTMSLRQEFVRLASHEQANRRELCRRFGISPQTGYKWLARFVANPNDGLDDRSRRPCRSPRASDAEMEAMVTALRAEHSAWGGRKISRWLYDRGGFVVAPSTVTSILHRHGLITPQASYAAQPWQRFEHPDPNALWQMDFKGYFPTPQGNCYPLTVLDDHSRFNLGLHACDRQAYRPVKAQLIEMFRRYGLPVRINTDNGPPWGCTRQPGQVTELAIWLIRQGIRISFSRPYHPQTNGKAERFHRSLKAEVLNGRSFASLADAQTAFDRWRQVYNHERPHQALAMATPHTRYRVSSQAFQDAVLPIQYGPDDAVVIVKSGGQITFKGQHYKVSNPLRGLPVGIRPHAKDDGVHDVYFMHHRLMTINLRDPIHSD